jgi:hypothetical protein
VAYVQENSITKHLFEQCAPPQTLGRWPAVTYGWIKLHRKLLKNHIFDNPKLLKTFLWCLLKSSHKEHVQMVGRQKILLEPGQFITGRAKAAEALDMPPSTAWSYLKLLEDDEAIEIQSNTKFSIVTVVNWEVYQGYDSEKSPSEQGFKHETEDSSDSRWTTSEQQGVNSDNIPIKQGFKHETEGNLDNKCDKKPDSKKSPSEQGFKHETEDSSDSRWTTNGQRADTNKNDKNGKNKKIYTHVFEHWNSKNIIKHRTLNDKTKRSINAKLKNYTSEEICQAIDNYAAIVHDDKYFFTYKWTLHEFLQRGFETFLIREVAHQNFLKDKAKISQGGEKTWRLLEDELMAQTLI